MAAAHGESPGRARRALVVGGGAAGLAAARGLRRHFRVAVVDAKEYFEFTPGVLRAYADPARWEALTFLYHEVLERHLGVRWIWGEVTAIDGDECCAHVLAAFSRESETIPYDFCVLAGGCHSNAAAGGSPWSPAVHARVRDAEQSGLDERYLEGRRRRVVEEHQHLASLQQRRGSVLIVGAGYTGVEFACELQHHLPGLCITVADSMERCLEPLPEQAASYCEGYMRRVGIRTVYGHDLRYDPKDRAFWTRVGLPEGADRTYVLSGVRSSAYFMPKETLSDRGPGGGGWILTNRSLQVVTRKGVRWGRGVVFAAGDCAASGVGPLPKTCYPAEQQAAHACRNIRALDGVWHGGRGCLRPCGGARLRATWYPWGAGVFVVSLGPRDGCVVSGATEQRGSGRVRLRGLPAAALKELIQSTKLAQYRGSHSLSSLVWHLVHHCPVNLAGRGPLCAC